MPTAIELGCGVVAQYVLVLEFVSKLLHGGFKALQAQEGEFTAARVFRIDLLRVAYEDRFSCGEYLLEYRNEVSHRAAECAHLILSGGGIGHTAWNWA